MKKEFILTDNQRICLGLLPIEDSWEMVRIGKHMVFFDGNVIRKKIHSEVGDGYYEADVYEQTDSRTILLPKTSKGKPRKLLPSTIDNIAPTDMYFSYSEDSQRICLANYSTQRTYFSTVLKGSLKPTPFDNLSKWLNEWEKETTTQDIEEIKAFKNAKRQHCKYQEGDYFAFKVERRKWGFGRIVFDVAKYRETEQYKSSANRGLQMMGKPLFIMVYKVLANQPEIYIQSLRQYGHFPVEPIMDNRFYFGDYQIIGHSPITAEEWEPMICYGELYEKETVYLQYGLIYKELPKSKFSKYLNGLSGEDVKYEVRNPYEDLSIGFGIRHYDDIREMIDNNIDFPNTYFRSNFDLRNPINKQIKNEIFTAFGLDGDLSYAENLVLNGMKYK